MGKKYGFNVRRSGMNAMHVMILGFAPVASLDPTSSIFLLSFIFLINFVEYIIIVIVVVKVVFVSCKWIRMNSSFWTF